MSAAAEKIEKPDLLTVSEAADYLSISRKSVDKMIGTGMLLPINLSTNPNASRAVYRLRRSDLDKFLRDRQRKPPIRAA